MRMLPLNNRLYSEIYHHITLFCRMYWHKIFIFAISYIKDIELCLLMEYEGLLMRKKENLPLYLLGDKVEERDFQFELLSIEELLSSNGNHPFEAHSHGFYQILWFREGAGIHSVDFKEYPVSNNSVFFLSPDQIHFFDRQCVQKGFVIQFNESFLSDEGSSENVFLKYNVFNAFDTVPYFLLPENTIGRLMNILDGMKVERANTNQFAHRDYLKYLVKLFLIEIQRIGQRGTGTPLCINNTGNRLFIRFRQTLEHHYRKMHTVKEYASYLNVSVKTLTNSVCASSCLTPLKIINDRIVLEAKRQLCYTDLKIKEIAFLLGFDDPSYFVKFFKRQTGIFPSEFREL